MGRSSRVKPIRGSRVISSFIVLVVWFGIVYALAWGVYTVAEALFGK